MAVQRLVATEKKRRKTPGNKRVLCPQQQLMRGRSARQEIGASPERTATFDPSPFLTELAAGKTSREYQTGEFVFAQGDAGDAVFYIQIGKVKLTVVSKRGKEAVVAMLPEASFFGEGCLAGQPLRMSTATAVQRSTIIRVTEEAMVSLLHREPEFAERFLAYLLSRNIRMEEDLLDQLFNSSKKRLARILLLMANFGQESKPLPITAKISQETLAGMVGTTRSRVSFFLNRFKDLGFIEYDSGSIHVHNSLISIVLRD